MATKDDMGTGATSVAQAAAPVVPPLRLFVVRKSQDKVDTEMVQAHQVGSEDGVLVFSTYKMAPDGAGFYSFTHRMFRVWHDMEEIFSAPSSGMVN